MLKLLLAHFDRIIFTRYQNNPRGVPPEELLNCGKAIAECEGSRYGELPRLRPPPGPPFTAWRNRTI